MARKLKVELDVDASEARRKVEKAAAGANGDASTAFSQSFSSSSSPSVKSQERLTKATELNSQRMLSMAKAFSGMAIGLAASYSSRYVEKGSTAEKALGYGGAAITGASTGSMIGSAAGPVGSTVGAAAGGIMALLKEYFDREGAKADATKEFEESEALYEGNKNFANDLKSITSPYNGESVEIKLATLSDVYDRLGKTIEETIKAIEDDIKNGDFDALKLDRTLLAQKRTQRETVYALAEKLETSRPEAPAASRTALTALQKIGGGVPSFSNGANGAVDVLLKMDGRWMPTINTLLREIRDNLGIKRSEGWL